MTTTQDTKQTVAIKGIDRAGRTVWYTGGAGERFTSMDRADAFVGFYLAGATRKANVLNRGTAFHGVHFSIDV